MSFFGNALFFNSSFLTRAYSAVLSETSVARIISLPYFLQFLLSTERIIYILGTNIGCSTFSSCLILTISILNLTYHFYLYIKTFLSGTKRIDKMDFFRPELRGEVLARHCEAQCAEAIRNPAQSFCEPFIKHLRLCLDCFVV